MSALEVRRLTVSYSAKPVLWDVDADFPEGALSAIVGPNGAGKSTLLRAALDRVAYVPQRDAVDWDFPITVREVVEMGRYPATGWFRRVRRADRDVRSVFIESSVPRQTIEAVVAAAREQGQQTSLGGELFSDAAGDEGTPEGTYVGMVGHNARTIAEGLR